MAVLRVTGVLSKLLRKPRSSAAKPLSRKSTISTGKALVSTNSGRITKNKPQNVTARRLELYDNTMLSDFRRCPRMWLFRHQLGWRPQVPSSALIFGQGWHDAMDVVWKAVCWDRVPKKDRGDVVVAAHEAFERTWEEQDGPYTVENYLESNPDGQVKHSPDVALEMLIHYIDQRWAYMRDPDWELLDIELPFAVPLHTDRPDLFYVGRLDKVGRWRGNLRVIEHKTTSMFAKSGGFQQRWIDSFSPNTQVEGYLYAASMHYGERVKDVFVDGALVHKDHHDRFRLIPIEKQWQQIDSWLWEAGYWIEQVQQNKRAVTEQMKRISFAKAERFVGVNEQRYLAAFPKNTNVCTDFSGCPYRDVCMVTADPTQRALPPGFVEDFWSPFDQNRLAVLFEKKE